MRGARPWRPAGINEYNFAQDDSGSSATTRDVISDFKAGVYEIKLELIDAKASTADVDDGFTWIGTADFQIQLNGVTTLTDEDFSL